MKKLIGSMLVAFAFAGPAALAEETLLDYVLDACEADIVEFCDTVTPGDGRLVHCMAAHEDKISSECAFALYDAAEILLGFVETVVYLAESCETDIKAYCAETPMGEGRILSCLNEKSDTLTETCRSAIDETVVEE